MSFIIKGKVVPTCCAACNRDLAAIADCVYTRRLVLPEEHDMRSGRHPLCPLVPVPPHDRLVEYHAAVHAVYNGYKDFGLTWKNAEVMLSRLPTIIPAEDMP